MTAPLPPTLNHDLSFVPILLATEQTGLLGAIRAQPGSSQELAERVSGDRRAIDLIIDVLVAFDLAQRSNDGIISATDRLRALDEAFPGGLAACAALYLHLPEFLRRGSLALPGMDDRAARGSFYGAAVKSLSALWQEEAVFLAAKLTACERPRRVLDAGCGAGVWGLEVLAHAPEATLTGFDLPEVTPAFEATASSRGLSGRARTYAGDLFRSELPGTFDLAIVANVLRIEEPARAAAIVRRVAGAVDQGGRLVVVDAIARGSPEADRARTLYAVNLALRTQHGRVHSAEAIRAFLSEAGLTRIEEIQLPIRNGALGALMGYKP